MPRKKVNNWTGDPYFEQKWEKCLTIPTAHAEGNSLRVKRNKNSANHDFRQNALRFPKNCQQYQYRHFYRSKNIEISHDLLQNRFCEFCSRLEFPPGFGKTQVLPKRNKLRYAVTCSRTLQNKKQRHHRAQWGSLLAQRVEWFVLKGIDYIVAEIIVFETYVSQVNAGGYFGEQKKQIQGKNAKYHFLRLALRHKKNLFTWNRRSSTSHISFSWIRTRKEDLKRNEENCKTFVKFATLADTKTLKRPFSSKTKEKMDILSYGLNFCFV